MSTKKAVKTYVFTTLFCIAVNYIYSFFGHGVSSPFMSYAFVFSLVLGVGGFLVLSRFHIENRVAFNLYNAGIATLTVGSILRGILDIAGADTAYPVYYFVVGAILIVIGVFIYLFSGLKQFKNVESV